jgi:hypothetical protein
MSSEGSYRLIALRIILGALAAVFQLLDLLAIPRDTQGIQHRHHSPLPRVSRPPKSKRESASPGARPLCPGLVRELAHLEGTSVDRR